jgi:hypothetical protein
MRATGAPRTSLAVAITVGASVSGVRMTVSPPRCLPVVHTISRWPVRVDDLLAIRPPTEAVALVHRSGRGRDVLDARFLPHDNLLVFPAGAHKRPVMVALSHYFTPPGLAASRDTRTVYVVVDTSLLLLDPRNGHVLVRWRLNLQALGWPAAMVLDPAGRVYIAGQHWNSSRPSAIVEALDVSRVRPPRVLWLTHLGVTHAGIWLGVAGRDRLAAYVPDAHDVSGTIAILDTRSSSSPGTRVLTSYSVDGPPAAADVTHDRLFLDDADTIRALSLRHGTTVSAITASGPLALDPPHGLLVFTRHGTIVLTSERTLRPLARVPLPGRQSSIRSLAVTPDGSTLFVGLEDGLIGINLGRCEAR